MNLSELGVAAYLQADYQRAVAREHHLWLRRVSWKPFTPPTRQSIADEWVNEQAILKSLAKREG